MDRIWLESYPDGVPADIDPDAWPSLNALIDDSLARHRSKPAYVCMDRTMTYGELDARSRAFAAWLGAQGLGRGARVANRPRVWRSRNGTTRSSKPWL